MDYTAEQLDAVVGTYLLDGAIKILSRPKRYDLLDGFTCLANVNGALCVILVRLRPLQESSSVTHVEGPGRSEHAAEDNSGEENRWQLD